MIFLTVGTQFPFDRLVRAVDEIVDQGILDGDVFAQIGGSSYQPRNFEAVTTLAKEDFDTQIRKSTALISHAGMGSITVALDNDKPLLVMPRRKQYGEVVNDHQVAIAREFGRLGCVLVAQDEQELPAVVSSLHGFKPAERATQPEAVATRISKFLEAMCDNHKEKSV